MGAYAWYYNDHSNDVCYWTYAYEMSATDFAGKVSRLIGRSMSASDTSYASGNADLERHQRGMRSVHI